MDNTSVSDTTTMHADGTSDPRDNGVGSGQGSARTVGRHSNVAAAEHQRKSVLKIVRRTLIVLVALVVVVILVALGAFINMRYFAHDDASDVQGSWYVAGTSTLITIDDSSIHLTQDVAYKYTLATDSKTIDFSIGNLEGGGHYRFSLDRQMLAITDGDVDSVESFIQDAQWTLSAVLMQVFQGETATPGTGSTTTLLSRTAA
jgi:hypothetical protein